MFWKVNGLASDDSQMLFFGILGYGHERTGVLGGTLNSHPIALKHLMPALMSFYVGQ
jgi:ubiquitin conjugation factor E4 B